MNNLNLAYFPVQDYTNFTNFYQINGFAAETGNDTTVLPRLKGCS